MIASVSFLSVLVSAALGITMVSPIVLIIFLIRDWRRGQQW